MSKLVFNRDGGKTDEFGHLIALTRYTQGEVIEGLQVAANGTPNMSVNVPYGVAAIPVGSGATAYRYFVGLDATENVAIPTANGSNPRNDLIVLWVDKSVTPSQSFTNNSNNMLKITVVSGAPATTPADPSVAAIQAAIGAANPYIILARAVVGAGVTQVNAGNITDLRNLSTLNTDVSKRIYPIGSVYINALSSTNPATLLGFGTWERFAQGKVLVDLDTSQTEFNTLGKVGGEKAHTLTIAEMPTHNHYISNVAVGSSRNYTQFGTDSGLVGGKYTDDTGGGAAHNNLQPYVTVYMWRRTA